MGRFGAMLRNVAILVVAVAVTAIPSGGALARSGTRDVRYRGLTLRVPASWPVFMLTSRSHTCVRFNRHAVYLGSPSADQVCPANAMGRTEAILVQPNRPGSAPAAAATGAMPASAGGEVRMVRDGVAVTATWGSDPSLVERALGLDSLPQQAGGGQSRHWTRAALAHAASVASTSTATASAAGSSGVGLSRYTGLAFDTCSAPTGTQLAAWKHSRYRGMGVYIGGANASCAQPNLTSGWISSVTGAGWHLLLIYVGLQAPRNSCGCAPIHPASAGAEGTAAADDAASRAAALGVRPGSPIYFDMEGYTERPHIRAAVLSFLAAWTTELHHDGYRSGVYSSADSGIADLSSNYGSGYPEPDDLWFAAWDGQASTTASYLPSTQWANHQRAHQFLGPHNLKYGGLRMNVDSDFVDAATVGQHALSAPTPSGAPGPHGGHPGSHRKPEHQKPGRSGKGHHHARWPRSTPQPTNPTADGALVQIRGTHAVYRIVGGAPLLVKYWADIGGRQPVRQISRRRFDALRAVPRDGSLIYTATGTVYRIAGGFPFVLTSSATRRSGAQLVDLWDLRHLSEPQVHLHAAPSNGTVIHAAPSGHFWTFENGHLFPASSSRTAVPVPTIDLGPWPRGCSGTGGPSGGSAFGTSCGRGDGTAPGGETGGGGLAAHLA
jgi:hypothetical protein